LGSSASFEELVWTAPKRARRPRGTGFIHCGSVARCARPPPVPSGAAECRAPTPAAAACALGPVYIVIKVFFSRACLPGSHCALALHTCPLSRRPAALERARDSRLSVSRTPLRSQRGRTLSRTCRCNVQAHVA
jgi:hypothetical protein